MGNAERETLSSNSAATAVGGPSKRALARRVARYRGGMVRLSKESDAGEPEGRLGGLNPRSFAAFYERYRPLLWAWFLSRTHNEHLTDELVSRTVLKAFERREQQRGAAEQDAVSWMLSIAHRELLQFYRRGRVEKDALQLLGRGQPPLASEESRRVEQLIDARATRTPLIAALEKLSRHQREAFYRRFVREESVAEVASAMGISKIAVGTAVFRARRRLAGDLRSIILRGPQDE